MAKYNRNQERINNSRILVNLIVNEFKEKYPEFIDDLKIKESLLQKPPGLPNSLDLSQSRITKLNLNPLILSVLCGTVLGDASLSIQKGYINARFQYRHSTRQTEWFMWKTLGPLNCFVLHNPSGAGSALADPGNNLNSIQFQIPDGHQEKSSPIGGECLGKLKVSSLTSTILTSLHQIISKNNKICIERHWLNHMNAYFLMTLWLDDGSLLNKRQGYFCLYSTPESELIILANYIKSVWHIDCTVQRVPSKKNSFHIAIKDQDNLYKLMQVIAPLIPVKTMLYKVCFYPTNQNLLERWTTEIKTLVRNEWHQEIDKQYLYHSICLTSSVEDIVQ